MKFGVPPKNFDSGISDIINENFDSLTSESEPMGPFGFIISCLQKIEKYQSNITLGENSTQNLDIDLKKDKNGISLIKKLVGKQKKEMKSKNSLKSQNVTQKVDSQNSDVSNSLDTIDGNVLGLDISVLGNEGDSDCINYLSGSTNVSSSNNISSERSTTLGNEKEQQKSAQKIDTNIDSTSDINILNVPSIDQDGVDFDNAEFDKDSIFSETSPRDQDSFLNIVPQIDSHENEEDAKNSISFQSDELDYTTSNFQKNDIIYIFCKYMTVECWNSFIDQIFIFDDETSQSRSYIPDIVARELQYSPLQYRRLWLKKQISNYLQLIEESKKLTCTCPQYVPQCPACQLKKKLEKSFAILYNTIKRMKLEYENEMIRLESLMRFGEDYLQQGFWLEGIVSYAECCELLRDFSGDSSMIKDINGTNRLVFFGYGHALFWKGKYIEAANAIISGFRYFHSFGLLPFTPQLSFQGGDIIFPARLNSAFNIWMSLKEKESQMNLRCIYQFLVGFYFHFDERRLEALDILEEIQEEIPESKYLVNSIKEILDAISNENETVKVTPSTLKEWSKSMSNPETGVEVKNRKQLFKTYESCFVGHDLVTWICKKASTRRSEAVDICKELYNRYFIRHVTGDSEFKDQFLYYRFQLELMNYCFTPLIREGEIQSKASGNKMQKFWAVLFVAGIILFDSKKSGNIKEIIDFGDPEIEINASLMDSTVFSIQKDDFVIGFYKSSNEKEANAWVDAINIDLKEYRNAIETS